MLEFHDFTPQPGRNGGGAARANRQARAERRAAPEGAQCNGAHRRSLCCGLARRAYRAATLPRQTAPRRANVSARLRADRMPVGTTGGLIQRSNPAASCDRYGCADETPMAARWSVSDIERDRAPARGRQFLKIYLSHA